MRSFYIESIEISFKVSGKNYIYTYIKFLYIYFRMKIPLIRMTSIGQEACEILTRLNFPRYHDARLPGIKKLDES